VNTQFDVVVVGAGLAGAAAASLLARHGGLAPERVALLGQGVPPEPAMSAPPDVRVVAISRASEYVLRAAEAWEHLSPARLCAYERMCVWHESAAPRSASSLAFDAADIGEPNLGFIAENSALVRAGFDSFIAAGGTAVDAGLEKVRFEPERAKLYCNDGREVTTRLVVGADGAHSQVRANSGLVVRGHDYDQLAIVATVSTARAHERTAWQRFLRTGPLALLPLFDGHSSIVWSLDRAAALELQRCDDSRFNQLLEIACDAVLGSTTLAGPRSSFPLRSVSAQSYVAPRCALIGDAAHIIHPLAGQGANLGLLDAAALCEVVADALAAREDPGALRVLRKYEQSRRTHNVIVDAAMSVFQIGFSAAAGPGAWLVNRALETVNRNGMLKKALARQAMGSSGELPRFARAAVVSPSVSDQSWLRK
jgi:2-octaprenylphenol hydroxylase